jgi:hypothetical protein
MNDSMSILLATTIMALGGLGLYMYKTSNDAQKDDYDEDSLFGGNLWGGSEDDIVEDSDLESLDDDMSVDYEPKPRKRAAKTQRNRKQSSTSRRRY